MPQNVHVHDQAGQATDINLRRVYTHLHLGHEITGGILDLENAFDFIDWNYMQEVLWQFGFGPSICQWITLLYSIVPQ